MLLGRCTIFVRIFFWYVRSCHHIAHSNFAILRCHFHDFGQHLVNFSNWTLWHQTKTFPENFDPTQILPFWDAILVNICWNFSNGTASSKLFALSQKNSEKYNPAQNSPFWFAILVNIWSEFSNGAAMGYWICEGRTKAPQWYRHRIKRAIRDTYAVGCPNRAV